MKINCLSFDSAPRFRLCPNDRADMGPCYIRGLRETVTANTKGVVEFTIEFADATFYRVLWEPTQKQKCEGWIQIIGDHSPDDIGYLLSK